MKYLIVLMFTIVLLIGCNKHQTFCTEGLMQPNGYNTYYSELPEASNVIINFNGIIGEFYVTEISKCSTGFCVESYEIGKLHYTGTAYILENGCHTK